MRRLTLAAVAVVLPVGCHHAKPAQTPLTAKAIMQQSTPAIVVIEAGGDRIGTGFILDKAGIVATNLHVVVGSAEITVKLKNGTKFPVSTIAGFDPRFDLALLRIKPLQPLPTLHLGDSDRMEAGDQIYAIGNPLGVFDYSISNGLVSAKRNGCEGVPKNEQCSDVNYIQFTAPISQGSSGGPLLNQDGEVIAITTAFITAGQNINLAVPTNYLKPMLAHTQQIAPQDFENQTKEILEKEHPGAGEDSTPLPPREIPDHAITVFDGCKVEDLQVIVSEIEKAIARGAPEYNKKTPEGFENCYRIYEGTSLKVKSAIPCKGVTKAFDDGLARAGKIKTYRDKAWALRDTFDGLLKVVEPWCTQDADHKAACSQKP